MKRERKRRYYEEVNYWESMTDALVGLLLCVLLIVLLLILYLMRIPNEEYLDDTMGTSYAEYNDKDDGGGNYGNAEPDRSEGDTWGHGDGEHDEQQTGGGGGPGIDAAPYEDPDPGAGEGQGLDKAAVYVQVVDGETGRTIKQKGMEYELYSMGDALQTLSVYYPTRIDYTDYETDGDGVFYLPEKIFLGSYYLHDLTTVEGYDTANQTPFTVERSYDWDDPYVVSVELYPSRSIIRVQLKDQDSGAKLGGASFQVVAAQNITTKDGTTRYTAGQLVDTITLDEQGYGESVPLYLGTYRLQQSIVPAQYAEIAELPEVTLQKRSGDAQPPLTQLSEQKTTVNLALVDALYRGNGLAGVDFLLSVSGGTSRRLTTDAEGRIELTGMEAGTTYRLRQVNALEHYEKDATEYTLRVDNRGLINGQAVTDMTITNTIIRVAVGVKDKLFRGLVSDVNVALFDSDGTLVKAWNSSALEQVIEGLEPGEYTLVMNGRQQSARQILVQQTADQQGFYLEQWTTADVGLLAGVAALLIAAAVLLRWVLRKKKQAQQKESD